MKIGELLISQNIITEDQLDDALKIQRKTGSRIGKILSSRGFLKHDELDRLLAKQLGMKFCQLSFEDCDIDLFDLKNFKDYLDNGYVFLKGNVIALCDPDREKVEYLRNKYNDKYEIQVAPKQQVMRSLHYVFNEPLKEASVYALSEAFPDYSAINVFVTKQYVLLYVLLVSFIFAIFVSPYGTLLLVNYLITFILIISFGFKLLLVIYGSSNESENKVSDQEVRELDEYDLPVYTILVPMYNEPDVLPIIVNSLRNLDYPKEKLDIKLVLEMDDIKTQQAAQKLELEDIFEICLVPDSQPKTKPKACNYALFFAKGEFTTIYDAEDKPEPDQLKKALITFKKSPANTAVVQARLNYYNDIENLLTKNFTMEYSLWFDFFLPGLEKIGVPIPLGGTSNHFKTELLQSIGGWDPFNVTEDADLGIRFYQMNYAVKIVNSTTFEEANMNVGNWIRQRSRWLKGYMQTYLVHMRSPINLYQTLGFKGFFSFQFFIGVSFVTALITPILYGVFFCWLLTSTSLFDPFFTDTLLYISNLNLLLGNSFFIYLMMIGVFKRGKLYLVPYALTVPFYWLLMSVAAYKALFQLFYNPFYWEKTVHGLSEFTKREIDELT